MSLPGRVSYLQTEGGQPLLASLHEHLAAQHLRQRLVERLTGGRAGQEQAVFEPGQGYGGLLWVVHVEQAGGVPGQDRGDYQVEVQRGKNVAQVLGN